MSKKRLRATPAPAGPPRLAGSKQEPGYWRTRLFKCRYRYRGRLFEVRNWSVKIQHMGKRRTFALRSASRGEAAAEACELYRALVTEGWRGVSLDGSRNRAPTAPRVGDAVPRGTEKFAADYWAERLIQREYTMSLPPTARPELSVRIDHGAGGHYFPLGTHNPGAAARRALRIYRCIVSRGWETANKRFSRELTVAFRWLDVPLAWTYTTIHTQVTAARNRPVENGSGSNDAFGVVIAESDAGTRRALEWCINHMSVFRCVATFASAAEALRELPAQRFHLALVNHSLADSAGTVCLEEMKVAAPAVASLLYSVYEDSEELFRTTPGGAGTYLLRRTPPTEFLEPILGWLKAGDAVGEGMAAAAWRHFKDGVNSMAIGGVARQLGNLTQREHEVLGLLSKGHPDKEIADGLGISIHTVHEHVRNILEKLGVHNRTEAAVRLLQK